MLSTYAEIDDLTDLLKFKNKFGGVTLQRRGRIVVASFFGAINASVLQFFCDNLVKVVGDLKGSPWGYLSSSSEAMVGTEEAEAMLIAGGKIGLQLGCVRAAYVLKSPVAIAQTRRIRERLGVEPALDEILFASESEAIDYLEAYLEQYQGQS
ncbi:hypothetical protein [Planctobacterium marinum]|uniref:hypothetical protein n=1 Tax=Planctobacterium marinum TaxID=1631968 RepID=UPI001E367BE9|nr:hypothetical protein [Planctobacterium marinum]MCC2604949.1 hypothetical protein [Planctobacterium marinum]